jgi:hypothetical protein
VKPGANCVGAVFIPVSVAVSVGSTLDRKELRACARCYRRKPA